MRLKKRLISFMFFIATSALCVVGCQRTASVDIADDKATEKTKKLYVDMKALMQRGIMFGHQDDLAYGHDWYGTQDGSDVKYVCGDYPALIGWELGHLEIGADFNLDSVYFSDMKRCIAEAHRRGSINTLSWHGDNIVTGNTAWDCKSDSVVRSILPLGENHLQYLGWLDRLAGFFSELTDDNGELIPIIFRMYHEHTGNWFWWGSDQCTADQYKQLWIMTVDYLRDKQNVHNLLYAYSPSEVDDLERFLERYPGDEYVDIIGFDCYGSGNAPEQIEHYKKRMDMNLSIVTAYAAQVDKIPIIGETGLESVSDSTYFTQVLYPVISKYKISSVLLWRNAWEPDKKAHHFYVPYAGHPTSEDFSRFINFSKILMCNDIHDI